MPQNSCASGNDMQMFVSSLGWRLQGFLSSRGRMDPSRAHRDAKKRQRDPKGAPIDTQGPRRDPKKSSKKQQRTDFAAEWRRYHQGFPQHSDV